MSDADNPCDRHHIGSASQTRQRHDNAADAADADDDHYHDDDAESDHDDVQVSEACRNMNIPCTMNIPWTDRER